ncbi:MAG: hypothetical protein JHC63_00015 [Acidimicrobiia bacterium]|nr:hypothetical protein [Acidimicrobiia bacterium]
MIGAVIIVFVLVIAIPVGFLMTMSIVAAVLGWTVGDEVDQTYAGTEDYVLAYPES